MPRYVDLDKLAFMSIDVVTVNRTSYVDIREVQQAMRQAEAQTGEVAPVVHAFWILRGADKRGRGGVWVCSACGGCEPCKKVRCPNCGAKMDGEAQNEKPQG